jgi:GDP-4-dehydro-6-deoxy-D-mannose reductase
VSLHRIDLRNANDVRRLVREVRPQVIQHLAAQSSVPASLANPMGTLQDNATMQLNVLEAIRAEFPPARVVVVGSCDEYGNVEAADNPVSESRELQPRSPYALSKVVQDLMGFQYAASYRLDVVRVRPFLQIGPRRPDRFVAGSFARQVAEIEAGLRSPVIRVGNIDIMRDFSDVRDVARAYAVVAVAGRTGEVYNISSGKAHSLRELLHAMISDGGLDVEIIQDPTLVRDGEAPVLFGDSSRLTARTGWKPMIPFEQSAIDTLDDWRDRIRKPATARGGMH